MVNELDNSEINIKSDNTFIYYDSNNEFKLC